MPALPLARWTVRQRLVATVAALVALTVTLVGATLWVVESRRVDRSIEESITQEIGEFRTLQARGQDPDTGRPFADADRAMRVFLERNLPDEGESLYAFGPTGGPIYQGSGDPRLQGSAVLRTTVDDLRSTGGTRTVEVDGTTYRIAVQPVRDAEGTSAFVVTHDVDASRDELRDLITTYGLLGALSVILVSGAAWWIAGRALRPLRDLRDTARGITDGDLSGRLEISGHDDLADLGITFNEMLDRLEAAFTSQRRMLDDAAHELRTPLTVLRGHLDVVDLDDPDDVAATRELLLDETQRMTRLVDDLLMLAKAQRPDFVRTTDTDVEALTVGVLDRSRALADRTWVLDGVHRGRADLDGQRITQAMLQLCANAARHTEPGAEIGLGSRRVDGAVQLWVRDTGRGVDPTVHATLFDRFSQAPGTSDGFGLGLSIVQAIAEAHGGTVVLLDTPSGATFQLTLPTGGPR